MDATTSNGMMEPGGGEVFTFSGQGSYSRPLLRDLYASESGPLPLHGDEPFVRLLEAKVLPDTKNVVGTNVIEIAWRLDPRTGRLIVMSAEDNLLKGASGQAVQSMNILCGFPETAGLG